MIDLDDELDDELDLPSLRGRPPKVLRQERPRSESVKAAPSWWETVKPGESMTQRAEQERERMASSKEWKTVSSNYVLGWPSV